MTAECVLCELEQMLRARTEEIRRVMQQMTSTTGQTYDQLLQALIDVDWDKAMLKGRMRTT